MADTTGTNSPGDRLRRRLRWVSGTNGFSMVVVALVGLLFSLAFRSWVGIFTCALIAAFGCLEVRAFFLFRQCPVRAAEWGSWSQAGVFLVIASYCGFQLARLSPASVVADIPQEMRQLLVALYGIDEVILAELLTLALQWTYVLVLIGCLVYQGGLFFYYRWAWRKLMALLPAHSSREPDRYPGSRNF